MALPSAAPLRDQHSNKLLDCLAITSSLHFKLFPGRKITDQGLNEAWSSSYDVCCLESNRNLSLAVPCVLVSAACLFVLLILIMSEFLIFIRFSFIYFSTSTERLNKIRFYVLFILFYFKVFRHTRLCVHMQYLTDELFTWTNRWKYLLKGLHNSLNLQHLGISHIDANSIADSLAVKTWPASKRLSSSAWISHEQSV